MQHPASRQPGNRPPANSLNWKQATALPIFIVALLLYVLTLAPTVASIFDDSLEFQLVTYMLGIAHPTGYPLYVLMGWLFTRLPIGDVAYRVNLMSAIFGALTVALVYLVNLEIGTQPRSSLDAAYWKGVRQSWSQIIGATLGALALAISPVFWSQATITEVYTLNAVFVAAILWLLVRSMEKEIGRPSDKWLLSVAFLFGLSLTHHRTMLLWVPAVLLYLWHRHSVANASELRAPTRVSQARWLTGLKLVATFFAPLLLYLYIPLRGHVGSLDGTYTNTLAGFWEHVTASGYGVFIFQNPFGTERGADFYLSLFLAQFGPLGLIAGLIGLAILIRRPLGRLIGIAFLTYLAFNLFYRVTDIEVFFIPLFVMWAIWIGAGVEWALRRLGPVDLVRPKWLRPIPSLAIVLSLLGQSAVLLGDNISALDRSDDWSVHDYGLDIMSQPMEPEAAIVGILGETTLVRYFQITGGLRPDLITVAADLEAKRLATVADLLEKAKPVYLTRQLPGASERWSLSALGPLIRVNSQLILESPAGPGLIDAAITPEISLHSYTLARPPSHGGSPPVRLDLTWQAKAPIRRDLKVSARLVAHDGEQLSQSDAVPVHFAYPTTAWRPGEFVRDVYDLDLPSNLEPGEYTPLIILYDPGRESAEIGRLALPPLHLP